MDERSVSDVAQFVVVQVEFAQMVEWFEFRSAQLLEQIVRQLKYLKGAQSVEGAIAERLDAAAVEVERAQVLAPDEGVARQFSQVVTVQVELSSVHRDTIGKVRVQRSRAVDNVGRPGGIVVAVAALRTSHFAVAGVKVAAVAQGEAVRLIRAEELFWPDVHQRDNERLRGRCGSISTAALVEAEAAGDIGSVDESGLLAGSARRLDEEWEPLESAVAFPRVVAEWELGQIAFDGHRTEPEGGRVQRLELIAVEINSAQIGFFQEGVGTDGRDLVVVHKELNDAVGYRVGRQFRQAVKTGVDGLQIGQLDLEVVAQFDQLILVDVEPLDVGGQERVVEQGNPVGANIEPTQRVKASKQTVDVGQSVAVEA